MHEQAGLRKSAVKKFVAFFLFIALASGVSSTRDIPEDLDDSVELPQAVSSESRPATTTTTLPSMGKIKEYFHNRVNSGPQISRMVTRVKQRYRRPGLHRQRPQRHSVHAGQGMMRAQPIRRPHQMRNHQMRNHQNHQNHQMRNHQHHQNHQMRNHRNPHNPSLQRRHDSRNQQLALDDQNAASAAQGQRSRDRPGANLHRSKSPSDDNDDDDEEVSVRINAMKTPRLNSRRWVRLRPQLVYPMLYPRLRMPSFQNSQARGNPSAVSAEALAMLTQKLSKMEASMARLKEAVVLQGAAHLRSTEKIEAKLTAQAEEAGRNGRVTRDILLSVRQCCACARRGPVRPVQRDHVPSQVADSPQSPRHSNRDFAPPQIHAKLGSPGGPNIGVRQNYNPDHAREQETSPNSVRNDEDVERQTTEPAIMQDNPEHTTMWNDDIHTPQTVQKSTAKFKQYILINKTDGENITEVIKEIDDEPHESENTPDSTPKEDITTTETLLETPMPTMSSAWSYGYAAAYRLNRDQLFMQSSEPQSLATTSTLDSKTLEIKDEESSSPHTTTQTSQTSDTTGETTSEAVPEETSTDADRIHSDHTSTSTTMTLPPESTHRLGEQNTTSNHPEESTPESILRILSTWQIEDEEDTTSPASSPQPKQDLAHNMDVLDKKMEHMNLAKQGEHYTVSEETTTVQDVHFFETTTSIPPPEEGGIATTMDTLETMSTTLTTTPQRPQETEQPVTSTESALTETATVSGEGSLQVDFSSGDIQNDGMPGVTWIVRPSVPGQRRPRRSSKRSGKKKPPRLSALDCSLQGVLKFTFTPPVKPARPTPRRRHRHHRRDREEEEEEKEERGGGGGQRRRKLMLNLEFWRPSQWVFNLGDSIANNGFSGDGAIQENDCEAQGYGNSFAVYASDKHPDGRKKLLRVHNRFILDNVTLIISDQTLQWSNHHGNEDSLTHASLFALSGQSDNQGPVNYDVFLGLNRVIDGSYRRGHGLCRLSAKWLT